MHRRKVFATTRMTRSVVQQLVLFAPLCCLATFAQQKSMPPATTERPLADRVATFERPERVARMKPDEVIQALHLKNGDSVADVGAGSGVMTRRFASAVAPNGKVYAVDIDAEILEYAKQEAQKQKLTNIVYIHSQPDDPMLPKNSVDLAFFSDTTHHIEHRIDLYHKLSPAIRKGGRIAIIDASPDAPGHPHKAEELVPKAQAIQEVEQSGFKLVNDYNFLPRDYFLVFEKQ
jgi:ubiquinone/menaquinone biosynthesis C-methylase UbiE